MTNAVLDDKHGAADFLRADSVLTPGYTGAITMTIANTVGLLFALPLAWVGLGVSLMFGALIPVGSDTSWRKGIYIVLNSLVIFCVAMGANSMGEAVQSRTSHGNVQAWLGVTPAHAQDANSQAWLAKINAISADPNLSSEEKMRRIQQLTAQQKQGASQQKGGFFQPWSFTKSAGGS